MIDIDKVAATVPTLIDRRGFFRKAAANMFKAAAVLSVGGGMSTFFSTPAFATCGGAAGLGCPTAIPLGGGAAVSRGCGTSRCCNHIRTGAPSSCNCATGTTCKTTSPCFGNDFRDYPTGCWTCSVATYEDPQGCIFGYVTTCCDCKTSRSICLDPSVSTIDSTRGRCIGWTSTYKKFGC
jgi:hypothetical protein